MVPSWFERWFEGGGGGEQRGSSIALQLCVLPEVKINNQSTYAVRRKYQFDKYCAGTESLQLNWIPSITIVLNLALSFFKSIEPRLLE